MACEHTPCESFKSHAYAIKWILGILVVVGAGGIGYSLTQSAEAKSEALKAKDKTAEIAVLSERLSSVQEKVSKLAEMDEKIDDVRISQSSTDGKIALILNKLNQLERAE